MDFVHRPGLQISRKHNVRRTGPPAVLTSREKDTLLGPLERANLNHWKIDVVTRESRSVSEDSV
jgi:hypothetical protein